MDISHKLDIFHLGLWFMVTLCDKFRTFSSSLQV